jgi:hypothetical protein
VAVNSEASTETLPVTDCAFAVIPSSRSNWVFTWVTVVFAPVSSGSVSSLAFRIATAASSRVRPSLISGTASKPTSTTNAPAAMSAATWPADTCPSSQIPTGHSRADRRAGDERPRLPRAMAVGAVGMSAARDDATRF